jgi:protein TonB
VTTHSPAVPAPRAATRVSAVSISVLLHVVVIAAGAWIQSGAAVRGLARHSSWDAQFEARVVAAPEPADEPIIGPLPPANPLGTVPPDRTGDDASLATFLEEADDEPPPAAAPTIAVDGGSHGIARPVEWSPRPRVTSGGFVGHGRGGRREGGQGRGGVGTGGEGGVSGEIAVPATVAPPPPPPPVRVEARVLEYVEPRYPDAARRRGLEGVVRVEVDLSADGEVVDVRVVESSGVAAFDEAARKAVRQWTFAAATLDGAGVASTLALPAIRFRLE